ncbi:Hypothetical protein MVR_LOCUS186 [uncultured virus]|nr:Hypothetical protein MVR_LOCUS186 [uncultured virus]
MDNDYYSLQFNQHIKQTKKEIAFYSAIAPTDIVAHHYTNQLTKHLNSITGTLTNPNQYDKQKPMIIKFDLNERVKEENIMLYSKDWNKLNPYGKSFKIKEYINALEYSDLLTNTTQVQDNKDDLFASVTEELKKKAKNKMKITYNKDLMRITAIDNIAYDNTTGLYYLTTTAVTKKN